MPSMRVVALSLLPMLALLGSGRAFAQSGPTQSPAGTGSQAHAPVSQNSLPNGSENATSGPQAHPAYPSGSTTANPGAAIARTRPIPATGQAAVRSGGLGGVTIGPNGSVTPQGGAGSQPARP